MLRGMTFSLISHDIILAMTNTPSEVEQMRHELIQNRQVIEALRREREGLVSEFKALKGPAQVRDSCLAQDPSSYRSPQRSTQKLVPERPSTAAVDERMQHIVGDVRSLSEDADALWNELVSLRSERDKLRMLCEETQSAMEANDVQHRRQLEDLNHQLEHLQREDNLFGVL